MTQTEMHHIGLVLNGILERIMTDFVIMQKGEPMRLMLTLDDAIKVTQRLVEDAMNDEGIIRQELEQKCWIPSDSEPAKRLYDLVFDINPAEICAQIESGNLKNWCKTIQVEMNLAMVRLPSAQPGITLESAIDYLHSIGWMQEHDRTLTESAQSERKKGKWIELEPKGVWTSVYHCSECGGAVMSCKVDLPKYCGHCGADMRGDTDE